MAAVPEDAPNSDIASDTPSQPSIQSTSDASTQTDKKRRFSTEKAAEALKGFGNKLKQLGQKAADSAKKFVEETSDEIQATKSMEGLLGMAATEFQTYIKQKADTTDKVKKMKKIADSFKNAEGICFVASFNVAFTVGGTYGRGIVMRRLSDGNWSLPLAIQEIEGNVGWQLNVSRSKTFYVLRNDQAIKNFQQKGNVKLGGKGFAAIGNLGIQAQGNVKASKESLTTTTNDAADVAATNASVGSVKGIALGANINLGTFQPCKKINDATYDNFDVLTLFNSGVNEGETSNGDNASNNESDEKVADSKKNLVKNDDFVAQLQEFIQLMEGVIQMEQKAANDAKNAKNDKNDSGNGQAFAAVSDSAPAADV